MKHSEVNVADEGDNREEVLMLGRPAEMSDQAGPCMLPQEVFILC